MRDPSRSSCSPPARRRALGVSVQTIKNWANAGQLQSVRLGGRVMIHRDSLLSFLDRIRRSNPAGVRQPQEPEASVAQREFVLSGLPADKVERAHSLTEKIEASQPLTPAEEQEMARLQDELAHVPWKRLKQWVAQNRLGPARGAPTFVVPAGTLRPMALVGPERIDPASDRE